ncbi:hypothetical protein L598_001600000230 [Mesorhizobium sp. J18]|uniref:hypothetical protein n=1 Tax=Mesorhizobium sp. J18 TaxID=935263 RepID=UPI00119A4E56|nr:hypothetical protein [Mesorhizobium sp. J18]TWG99059.1 hypothetical protein L598_001600000230 [Mesorhizobium sp. J18]
MNASARDDRKKAETLDYMQSMLGQLRTMAEAEQYDMLAYFIEMAYVEATDIIRGERPARLGSEESGLIVSEKKRHGTS